MGEEVEEVEEDDEEGSEEEEEEEENEKEEEEEEKGEGLKQFVNKREDSEIKMKEIDLPISPSSTKKT